MDKMSIWSVIFVSFPEEILFVITAMLIAGYTEIVNFKNRNNLIKILIASIFMVVSFDVGRYFLTSVPIYTLLQIISVIIIIYLVFKCSIKSTLFGTINASIIIMICDSIAMYICYKILKVSGEQIRSDDLLRILIFTPKAILQFIIIMVIIRVKRIDLVTIRSQLKYALYLSLLFFVILGFIFIFGSLFDNFDRAKYEGFGYMALIIFGSYSIAVLLVLFYMSDEKKKRLMADKKRDGELERMKQLIHEGKIDQVLDLIEYSKNNKET